MEVVQPIRDAHKVDEILEGLERDETEHGKRIYLLFATMLYTGLRVSDVVKLQKKQVTGEYFYITEQKTGKRQRITIPKPLQAIYDNRLSGLQDNDYLFKSRKHRPDGTDRHITTRDAGYDMKIIQKRFSLNFPFACHSVRKTFGYMHYKAGRPIEALRQRFNHSNENVTRRYIGVDEEEREKYFADFPIISYEPPKADGRKSKRKGKAGEDLIVTRQDKTENGKKWGRAMSQKAQKVNEKKKRTVPGAL